MGDEPNQPGSGNPLFVWPAGKLPPRRGYPIRSSPCGRRSHELGIEQTGWQSHFAMAAGGGIDVKVSKHFSLRPIQAEYFMIKISDGLNNRQNNFRFG